MDLIQIPPEKRIPLPAPDYDRLFLEVEMEFLLERERRGFALTSEPVDPNEPFTLHYLLTRKQLMEEAVECLFDGEPLHKKLMAVLTWMKPPAMKTAPYLHPALRSSSRESHATLLPSRPSESQTGSQHEVPP